MVWEGLDGLWAWGSVTQASKFLRNIYPKSVVTDWKALMKASGSEGKVWAVRDVYCLRWSYRVTAEPLGWGEGIGQVHSLCPCSLLYGLDLKINKYPSSALASQIQTHLIWIPIHSGWVSLADFTVCSPPAVKKQSALQNQAQMTVHCERFIGSAKPDISHVLMSYLHRCLSHRRMPSPWKCHSLLLSSPAGRRSASRSCPECICHCRCTSQGIPLQGKQPHVQMHSKHKATQPGNGLIKQLFPFCLQFISLLPLSVFPPGMNTPWCQDGGDHSMGRAASGSPRRSSQHNLTHCTQGMVSFRGALRYSCFIGCKSKAAHCPLSPSKHLLCKTSTQGYLSCIWG